MSEMPWVVLLFARATAFLLAGAAAVALLRRGSAAGRHLVLSLSVAALLILPLLSAVVPRRDLPVLPAGTPREATRVLVPPPLDVSPRARTVPSAPAESEAPPTVVFAPLADRDVSPTREAPRSGHRAMAVFDWIALVWVLGAGAGILQAVWAAVLARRALGRATEIVETRWMGELDDASRRLGLRRKVRLLMSDAVRVPVVYGFRRPAILLPPAAGAWPEARSRAFLLHELAHVRREDWLTQMMGHLARALYWPHPLAWWAVSRLRAEAERASDDCVLLTGTPALDYADHLLLAARELDRARQPSAVLAVVERSRFEDRLLALLDSRLRRRAPGSRALGLGALTALALAVGVSGLQPVARALPQVPHRPLEAAASALLQLRVNPAAPVDAVAPPTPVNAATSGAAPLPTSPPAVFAGEAHAAAMPIVSAIAEPRLDPLTPEAYTASLALENVPAEATQAPAPPQPAASATPARNVPVIRISTDLVQIDAVVTDKQGRYVVDLRPEEVELFEDGRRQRVSHVHYVAGGEDPAVDAARPVGGPEAGQSRTLVLVVDDLGLSLESSVRARKVLEEFVSSRMDARDRAVIVLTSGLTKAQTVMLTSDREALVAAARSIRYRPWSRAALEGEAAQHQPWGRQGREGLQGLQGEVAQGDVSRRHAYLAIDSLEAVKRTVSAMRAVPGRKAVILLSDGFSALLTHDPDSLVRNQLATPLDALYEDTTLRAALRSLTDMANRASVVIYALDPAGLQTNSLVTQEVRGPGGQFDPAEAMRNMQSRSINRESRHGSLLELAAQTGGLALTNSNDLAGGLGRIVADHSGYYLIGYEPEPSTFQSAPGRPRFHEVKIQVKRRGLKVRSRKGFYGVTDEEVAQAAPIS
jgi:VWFA-related protein